MKPDEPESGNVDDSEESWSDCAVAVAAHDGHVYTSACWIAERAQVGDRDIRCVNVTNFLWIVALYAQQNCVLRHEAHLVNVVLVIRDTKFVAVRIDVATDAFASVKTVSPKAEASELLKLKQSVRVACYPVS